MKNFLLFLFFVLVGFVLIIGYSYWNRQERSKILPDRPITTQFSLVNAPTESLRGKIITMAGVVNWESRIATIPAQLKSPVQIQQGEVVSTGANGSTVIQIQNDASISLNPNSLIDIIQLLPVNMVISQNTGSVYYQNFGQIPLSVVSLDLETMIKSGFATIAVNQTENTVTVTVEKGSVTEGYEDTQDNSNVVTVTAGNQFVFDDTAKIGAIQ